MTLTGPMAVVGQKNPVLRQIAVPVLLDELNHPGRLKALTERMLATVRVKGGIAIAAPQVGVSQRIIVTWDGRVIINPDLKFEDDVKSESQIEGCLSIPGRLYSVERPVECSIDYVELDGKPGWAHVEGLDARMFQHEVDHLDGILISERGTESRNGGFGAMKF